MSGHIVEMIGNTAIIYGTTKKQPEWSVCEKYEKTKLDKNGNRVVVQCWYKWLARTNISLEVARKLAMEKPYAKT